MKKIVFLSLFLIVLLVGITGCLNNNSNNKDNQNSDNNIDNNINSEYMTLEDIISNKKFLVNELYFDNTTDDDAKKNALEVFKTWSSLIGFSGYQAGSGYIELMSFEKNPSKSFYYYYTGSLKYIDFKCTYYNDFSAIDVNKIVLQLEAVYGVDIDENLFNSIVKNYKVSVYDLESKSYNNTVVYNKDNIYIEIAELYDGSNRIINFASSYNKQK